MVRKNNISMIFDKKLYYNNSKIIYIYVYIYFSFIFV